ncbi:hypothetical protein QJS04_geneDACA011177 [Acorus gramineus]|uniref:Uncharacterized protein n=1 Tax=Acorus gramineus TaxID=55184 RepID=A0AAV9AKI3_ACOGR|nr:hypothetical protein QJS04_geneDACA011177 [Acorus gramineus]
MGKDVQHLTERCPLFNMTEEECVAALSKHANINFIPQKYPKPADSYSRATYSFIIVKSNSVPRSNLWSVPHCWHIDERTLLLGRGSGFESCFQ